MPSRDFDGHDELHQGRTIRIRHHDAGDAPAAPGSGTLATLHLVRFRSENVLGAMFWRRVEVELSDVTPGRGCPSHLSARTFSCNLDSCRHKRRSSSSTFGMTSTAGEGPLVRRRCSTYRALLPHVLQIVKPDFVKSQS